MKITKIMDTILIQKGNVNFFIFVVVVTKMI